MNAPAKSSKPIALDARSLGRPVHLLPAFSVKLRELLDGALRPMLNRRYRTTYQCGDISIDAVSPSLPSGKWISSQTAQGYIACQMDRAFVLSVMNHRYGPQGDTPPETATEERLRQLLARQWLQTMVSCLTPMPSPTRATTASPSPAPVVDDRQPPAGTWLITVPFTEQRPQAQTAEPAGRLLVAVDSDWMSRSLREQAAPRNKPSAPLPQGRELAAQMQLKLVAHLLQTELPLGDLLDLQVGTVIPVRMQSTEVLIDGSRLFRASVAEHQGKLCLTSFEDIDLAQPHDRHHAS